ncbi:MAG: hypothetical protein KY467_18190 [Gemmatimonadetes bacterium]|nr:hypothetical protein [Gemmatimonadota bacterium]
MKVEVRGFLMLVALAFTAGCANAQAPTVEGARAEAARIEAALVEIEARVLADPELSRMNQALGDELLAAMLHADPGLGAAVGRLELLRDRRSRAIQDGDAAAAADAARRIERIERRYLRAQEAALRDPPLAERAARFNALLRRRMVQADQAAEDLLRRYAELQALLAP